MDAHEGICDETKGCPFAGASGVCCFDMAVDWVVSTSAIKSN